MASLLKCLFYSIRNFLIVFLAVALIPGIPPKTHFDIESFTVPKAKPFTGPLAVNKLLDNTEHLYENRLHGAECIISRGNEIYASLANEVVKITGNHITHVAKFGKPCNAAQSEAVCGRPLGLAFDTITDGLIATDAYHGVYHVDLKSGKATTLVSAIDQDGKTIRRKPKLFNAVAVQSNGDIFWTDSSSDYDRINGLLSFFANPSGRLFQYNRSTGKSKLLLDNLYFANGVALSPNEDFVVVAETAALRVTRYHLKGSAADTSDVFIDGLPGTPDNLTPDADGLWVPLGAKVSDENPAIWLSASNAPLIRKFILRIMHLIEMPIQFIQNSYPNVYTQAALNFVGSFESAAILMPKGSIVVRMDWNGKIVGSLHSNDGSIGALAHVVQVNDYLWMGSYSNGFIGRKKLPVEFQFSQTVAKVRKVNPTENTTAKPLEKPKVTTTTTPKPTTTTTPRPKTTTTTTSKQTTTPKPATTQMPTTTPKPATTQKPATTPKPATTTQKPSTTTTPKAKTEKPTPPTKPSTPAPIHEDLPVDTKPPQKEKLRVIKKGGVQEEL